MTNIFDYYDLGGAELPNRIKSDRDSAADSVQMEMATVDRLLIAGMHVHFPGFAHVTRWGDGYRLEAEAWSPIL